MFGRNSYKPKSNTKKAKSIIRSEMLSYFNPKEYGVKTRFDAMKMDVESAGYDLSSDYQKAKRLVNGGSCACYYSQTEPMLNKIYGKKQVSRMSDQKKWDTYRHLIAREYDSMAKENGRKQIKRVFTKRSKCRY